MVREGEVSNGGCGERGHGGGGGGVGDCKMSQRKKVNAKSSREIFVGLTKRLAIGPRIVDPREIRRLKPHLVK
jgi:hypothetical protein